ncbi:YncE family protein [Paenibacillus glycanilyticus]|uniref:YncE family protein n=1 Tax=Paenibacillus glycanilyticus TaxID=126569 RepID=A0ABQ6GHB0_9BACL|nr:YncE family protein [Paenibacillus glycanilyticus]GLX70339.1 hypothetical protein MU1_46850 [Paenibacillus glycanilyticus]
MKLYSRGKKESAPLLLYLPQKQTGFLCPPDRVGGTTPALKNKQKPSRATSVKPSANASHQNRNKYTQRKFKGREVPEGLDRLEEMDIPELEAVRKAAPAPERVVVPSPAAERVIEQVPVQDPVQDPVQVPVQEATPTSMPANRIYAALQGENRIMVMDGATEAVVDAIELPSGSSARSIAVNAAANRIYAIHSNKHQISVIDGSSREVIAVVPVSPFPSLAAVNEKTNRVYITSSLMNAVDVLNGATNQLIETVGVGNIPAGIAVNKVTNRIYVANGSPDHDLSVIDGVTNTRLFPDIPLQHEPGVAGVHTEANLIYVPNFKSDSVTVIYGATNTPVTTITDGIGSNPYCAAVHPGTNLVYVTNSGSDNVSVIDASSHKVIHSVPVGHCPKTVAVNTTTNRIYVLVMGGIAVLDGESNELIGTIKLPGNPSDIALSE